MVPLVHINLDRASVREGPETQCVSSAIGSSLKVILKSKPNGQFSICVQDHRLTITNKIGVSAVSTRHNPKQTLVIHPWVRVEVKLKPDFITGSPDWDRGDNLV